MTEIRKEIERILRSDTVSEDELSRTVNALRSEGRSDIIGNFTKQLLAKHCDDTVLMLRAWYLINYEENYTEGGNILRTIGSSDSAMFALLSAAIVLRTQHDADAADCITERYAAKYGAAGIALEAARLFIFDGFTDMAEKWIAAYEGDKDADYLMVYAEILIANERYAEAASALQNITAEQPHYAEAWIRLSDVLITMKRYPAAAEAAQHAAATDTGCRRAAENMRVCSLCMNRHNNSKTINPNKINNKQ